MLNCYGGVMDVNLVLPLGHDRTRVVFDASATSPRRPRAQQGQRGLGGRIQHEDRHLVRPGAWARARTAGGSVRREAGEHLFHRLLAADCLNVGSP